MNKCPFCKVSCGMKHCPYYEERTPKLLKIIILLGLFALSSCRFKLDNHDYIIVTENMRLYCDYKHTETIYFDCKDLYENYYEEAQVTTGVILTIEEK